MFDRGGVCLDLGKYLSSGWTPVKLTALRCELRQAYVMIKIRHKNSFAFSRHFGARAWPSLST